MNRSILENLPSELLITIIYEWIDSIRALTNLDIAIGNRLIRSYYLNALRSFRHKTVNLPFRLESKIQISRCISWMTTRQIYTSMVLINSCELSADLKQLLFEYFAPTVRYLKINSSKFEITDLSNDKFPSLISLSLNNCVITCKKFDCKTTNLIPLKRLTLYYCTPGCSNEDDDSNDDESEIEEVQANWGTIGVDHGQEVAIRNDNSSEENLQEDGEDDDDNDNNGGNNNNDEENEEQEEEGDDDVAIAARPWSQSTQYHGLRANMLFFEVIKFIALNGSQLEQVRIEGCQSINIWGYILLSKLPSLKEYECRTSEIHDKITKTILRQMTEEISFSNDSPKYVSSLVLTPWSPSDGAKLALILCGFHRPIQKLHFSSNLIHPTLVSLLVLWFARYGNRLEVLHYSIGDWNTYEPHIDAVNKILQSINTHCLAVKELTFSDTDENSTFLENFQFNVFPQLHCLSFVNMTNLHDEMLKTIVIACKTFSPCLTSMKIVDCDRLTIQGVCDFLSNSTFLKQLQLHFGYYFRDKISLETFFAKLLNHPTIQQLEVFDIKISFNLVLHDEIEIEKTWNFQSPNLRQFTLHLPLQRVYNGASILFHRVIRGYPQLTRFDYYYGTSCVTLALPRLQYLRELLLDESKELSIQEIEELGDVQEMKDQFYA